MHIELKPDNEFENVVEGPELNSLNKFREEIINIDVQVQELLKRRKDVESQVKDLLDQK